VFNATCISVLFCFASVLKVRCLSTFSLFCRLPYITSVCLCTLIYFFFGFCHILVRLPICVSHPVGLVTSLVSRARFNPYFVTDMLAHVLVYLFCFHINQYVTTISIPVSIMFSFTVASHGTKCRLPSWRPVLDRKISAYRHQPFAVDLSSSSGVKRWKQKGFTSRTQHSDISGHLLQNSILIPFIYLTGQFNVLNFPTCNTETTRHCQPGLYTHFCVKGNNLSFFIFYVFLGLVIVTTVKPVLNGPCIKWNLS